MDAVSVFSENELETTNQKKESTQEVLLVSNVFRENIFTKKFGSSPYDSDRVQVEFFSNEKSIKERLRLCFIINQRSSVRIRTFNLLIKLLTCLLYVIRVHQDDSLSKTSFELPHPNLLKISECWNRTFNKTTRQSAEDFRINPCINWDAILYIKTPLVVWVAQVICAFICYLQTLLMTYLTYKGNIVQSIIQANFLLDTYTSFTLIFTIWWPPLRHVFIPIFLNCWLAKGQLENSFNDLHRAMQKSHSALAQRLMVLTVTMLCLVFTGACAIQHFQRGGNKQFSLFESVWYIIVTFSTVGYGDIYPDIWPSQLFMIILIITVLVVLPSQFEQLALIYMEKQKRGTTYSRHRAENEKHVVVCSTNLQPKIIMDFLNEFYAHPMLQNFYVILMSTSELDPDLAMILQVPIWSQRVIPMLGSALNNSDLNRAQMEKAEACFILAARNYQDRQTADNHSILRSWAIKDYAPNCIQYIHLLKPENKMHIQHTKHIVEDEFKYALLANNCLCPGLSTFMTLLLHTSRGDEGNGSDEEWQKLYGKCSGNEIYHIKCGDSKFFKEYVSKSFTYASFHSHRKFGVALISCQSENDFIKLNPGPSYIMKATDTCFYMSITKEENSSLLIADSNTHEIIEDELSAKAFNLPRQISFIAKNNSSNKTNVAVNLNAEENFEETNLDLDDNKNNSKKDLNEKNYIQGLPPNPPYVGCSSTICHLIPDSLNLCCLKLYHDCEHSTIKQLSDYKWENKTIILAAKDSNVAIYNFIVPLRSYSLDKNTLYPILIMLENEPSVSFLEVIKFFPLVYWSKGSIECLEDLLRAGINEAEYLIIVSKEKFQQNEEMAFEDCNTILAVQYIFRMFPKLKICSEIVDSHNMRFMQFRAYDKFSLQISKREKIEEEKGSQISYLFRTPFASGFVFSAEMIDTLLYQCFVKSYLIDLVRLMLGLDQTPGSGHLVSKKISQEESWIKTYGRLYQNLCSTTYEIPIGIYRTETIKKLRKNSNVNNDKEQKNKESINKSFVRKIIDSSNIEIEKIIRMRMKNLGINQKYDFSYEKNEFSYVIINPSYDLTLKANDIVLIIRPDRI